MQRLQAQASTAVAALRLDANRLSWMGWKATTHKSREVLMNCSTEQCSPQNSIVKRKLFAVHKNQISCYRSRFSTCLRFDAAAFNQSDASLLNQFVQSFSPRRLYARDATINPHFFRDFQTKGSEFSEATDDKKKEGNCVKMAPKLAPTVKLNNGCEMPVLGLGTYELKKSKCFTAVKEAIGLGYRHIDTAYLYRNESYVGQALSAKIADGTIERKDIFLVTKLWNIFHDPAKVIYACGKQLELLGVDYIDLYLMHSPVGYKYVDDDALMPHENDVLQTNDVDYVHTYKAMEELVQMGLVRSIGLSNFNSAQIQRVLDNCRIKPATNQVECHPGLNQNKLREFCRMHDIVVTAYSPLARPKLSRPLPTFYIFDNTKTIAKKYNKTVAQVILRYLSTDNDAEKAVKHAIDVGYRHIDTAYFYQNEDEIGKAIRDKITEGVVKREDIFLVTKLWNIHHDPQLVEAACRKQLAKLGLDYIDLYLMHLPVGYKYVDEESLLPKNEDGVLQLSDVDYLDTYVAMEKLVGLGLVRSIGVSNFNSEQLKRVLDNCSVKPVTNQVECSPALNQKKLTQFCKEHGVTLTAYSPLGRPKPAEKTPTFYFSEKTKSLADKYNKTPAQIILRYLVDIGTIPIPKSSNPQRIEENFNIFDFELTPADVAVMDEFHTGERLVPFNLIKGQNHKYFPFAIDF